MLVFILREQRLTIHDGLFSFKWAQFAMSVKTTFNNNHINEFFTTPELWEFLSKEECSKVVNLIFRLDSLATAC